MIKGYDAQVMLHRTLDLAQSANAVNRRNETAQSLMFDQQREKIEREQEMVNHLDKAEQNKVRADADGRRRESSTRQQHGKEDTGAPEAEISEPKVFPVHNRVDIRV